jgi:anthranilate phosphoribosyltransferase
MTGTVSEAQTAALLTALRAKGEAIEEIAGFAETMRAHAKQVSLDLENRHAVDTCGTGGDGHNTFNVSTTAAFVVAGAGVPVAKHGNRAASSQTGSADLLEALGAMIVAAPERVSEAVARTGFGFMHAPEFHPAMRFVMPIRRALGIPTVFNILGPLSNPAGVRRQVIGVRDIATARTMASVMQELGSDRVLMVTSCEGADELTLSGVNHVVDYDNVRGTTDEYEIDPRELGMPRTDLSAIRGGNAAENAVLSKRVLDGEEGAHRQTVVLNAAAALVAAGRATSIQEGLEIAIESIDSGAARAVVSAFIAFSNQTPEEAVA